MVKKMGKVAVEPKYDGQRVQIHYKSGKDGWVKAFTRNLEEVTYMFPELLQISKQLDCKEAILDSEAVGYDPKSGKAISYLVSLEDQVVEIPACNMEVQLKKWEAIQTEISQKYEMDMIHELAGNSGFRVCKDFFDSNRYFVNSIWEKK